ncbi:MAG TPA: hypothetical protein VN445_08220 [Rectinemataceae bacterium]|nr:hypothetical protein [Rectinemataceae bacterium]
MRNSCRRCGALSALAACAALLLSCGLECLFVHTVIVETPECPAAWSGMGALTYAFSWKDEAGMERHAFASEGVALVLRLKRGEPQAILATPSYGEVAFLPAGALYPFDLETPASELPSSAPDRLNVSFASGYAASVARRIEEAGYVPWAYPLEKLEPLSETKGVDPWAVPPWKVADLLLNGTFRVSVFRAAAGKFSLPEGARWWPKSPLCFLEIADGVQKAGLSEGMHLFFSEKESLLVKVEGGEALMQRSALSK